MPGKRKCQKKGVSRDHFNKPMQWKMGAEEKPWERRVVADCKSCVPLGEPRRGYFGFYHEKKSGSPLTGESHPVKPGVETKTIVSCD